MFVLKFYIVMQSNQHSRFQTQESNKRDHIKRQNQNQTNCKWGFARTTQIQKYKHTYPFDDIKTRPSEIVTNIGHHPSVFGDIDVGNSVMLKAYDDDRLKMLMIESSVMLKNGNQQRKDSPHLVTNIRHQHRSPISMKREMGFGQT